MRSDGGPRGPFPDGGAGASPPGRSRLRGEAAALGALAVLVAITAGWWALALWPVPPETPEWLLRTREVCFGRTVTGLPDAGGWILLVGQPIGMLGLLLAGWRGALGRGLAAMWRTGAGRAVLGSAALLVVAGVTASGVRVSNASAPPAWAAPEGDRLPPSTYPTLDRPAPGHVLVDQHGEAVGIETFRGRPVLVTFAFGHCETVCPVVVQRIVRAREELSGELDPALVVVTLDPWRDTPSRLGHMAEQWMLPPDARVLGGEVDEVEAALDAWQVARSRDARTGDVVHPALVYVVDRQGVIRYATTDGAAAVAELARRAAAGAGSAPTGLPTDED